SRRIGRTPQLAGTYGDTVPLAPTTILGAAKLLGRFPGGFTLGVLDATTQRSASPGDTTFEPSTNYAVARVKQDFRSGNSSIGGIFTAVNRSTDQWTSPYLASSAYAAAMDFRHRMFNNRYEFTASLDKSRVDGSRTDILALQRNSVHRYQRPDAGLQVDSNRTSLDGDAEEFHFGKIAGQHMEFESSYLRRSAG